MPEANQQGGPDYKTGYKRPPKNTQFKPGQRANPKGRPQGSPNKKTIIEQALLKKISVRRGSKICRVALLEAMAESFMLKAAQGDYRAASVVINLATKTGAFSAQNDNTPGDPETVAADPRPSSALVESVNPTLLSKNEQIELSRIAEAIDLGGDVTALNKDDFVRLQQIVNKGRGKDISPKADDDLKEAA